jgi:cell division protein FtsL
MLSARSTATAKAKAPAKSKRAPRSRVSILERLSAFWDRLHAPGFAIALALTLTSLVVVALLHVWTRLEIVRIGYALSEETKLHQALREHEQRLRLELASRKDPAAIERIAREQLHMAPPDSSAIRIVSRSEGGGRR